MLDEPVRKSVWAQGQFERRRQLTYIVEFAGRASSGKSFFSQRVCERLKQQGFQVDYNKRCPNNLRTTLRFLPQFVKALFMAVRCRPASLTKFFYIWRLLTRTQVMLLLLKRNPGIHILDEGLFHKFKQIRRESRKNPSVANRLPLSEVWHNGLPACDALVIIDPDVETVQANRVRRGRRAKENIDSGILVKNIAAYRRDAEYLQGQFQHFNYIIVPNRYDTDIEAQVDQIVEFILTQASSPCVLRRVP